MGEAEYRGKGEERQGSESMGKAIVKTQQTHLHSDVGAFKY